MSCRDVFWYYEEVKNQPRSNLTEGRNFEQTKARIHRVGQRMPCTYLYLVARGTVDEKVLLALKNKADLAKTLVDDYRSGKNPFAA